MDAHQLWWHQHVIWYLYLAGLGAGAVTVSACLLLLGGSFGGGNFKMARYGALIGPFPVIVGTAALIFELGRPFRALNLFKVINLSPMSIGSWFLLFFIVISLVYAVTFLPTFAPHYQRLNIQISRIRRALAWFMVPLGVGVAVYTGVLLGAMPARPLWNSPILAFMFVISALSTGVALVILISSLLHRKSSQPQVERQYQDSSYLLTTTDTVFVGIELMIVFLFIMFAHLTIGNVKYAVAVILPGGELALEFWLWVVLIGLVLPGLIELAYVIPRLIYNLEFRIPRMVEILLAVAVLVGGYMLRYVIVIAGQMTGPVGL
jgi:formate-dependent nitrite reductase membrane component NrfD